MSFIEADHFGKIPKGAWKWPAFSPAEIACRGTGAIKVSVDAMDKLQALRLMLGAPMIINSAYRSPAHNKKIGGARNSQHLLGIAFDVSMANHDPEVFVAAAKACGFTGIGWYPPGKGDFIHLDTGKPRTWGTPWKAPRFDAEPKAKFISAPAAVATTTVTTVAAAFEAVDPENLAAIQAVVQPMIPYASIFQGVFVACGVGIVLWTVWKRFFKRAP
jgi:zinc D-Ala-D-Ala carboxypeptidase